MAQPMANQPGTPKPPGNPPPEAQMLDRECPSSHQEPPPIPVPQIPPPPPPLTV